MLEVCGIIFLLREDYYKPRGLYSFLDCPGAGNTGAFLFGSTKIFDFSEIFFP